MLFDTHCHVQFDTYDEDRDLVMQKCEGMLLTVVGTELATNYTAIALAEQYPNVYASVGLHPTEDGGVFDPEIYTQFAKHPKVVAIGETGMDRHHVPKGKTAEEIHAFQKELFLQHYAIALAHNLPLVIHVRDAHEEMLAVLENLPGPIQGTVHCYTGNWAFAKRYLACGLHLGFTGIVTYPPRKSDPEITLGILETILNMPLERILIETDAPFLAPQKYRGSRAEPWMVGEVAEKIAELRGLTREEIEDITTGNAKNLFVRREGEIS